MHIRIPVLGHCCDRWGRLVWVCSLHNVGSLLGSFFWPVPKVNHILAGICEQLFAKALEVPVNQCQRICKHTSYCVRRTYKRCNIDFAKCFYLLNTFLPRAWGSGRLAPNDFQAYACCSLTATFEGHRGAVRPNFHSAPTTAGSALY